MVAPGERLRLSHDRNLSDLFTLLRHPSISALPDHRQDVRAAAQALAGLMGEYGIENVEVIDTPGHPVVYGEYLHAPGRPTALVYGHYDVQPVDPLGEWQTPPFEPSVRDNKVYARGATDDKGQVLMHLIVARELIAAGELSLNLKFIIEGEEEVGSKNLHAFVAEHRELLACDFLVISDSPMLRAGHPAICTGLRGMSGLELTLRTADHDLHSGLFGGAVPNALHDMVELLSTLHGPDGRIAVEGFYDGILDPSEEEAASFRALSDDDAFRAQSGARGLFGEVGRSTLERIWSRPTLELNGVWGGFTGEGNKTVIPAEAHAKITCRLVPGQDPGRIQGLVSAHLRQRAPAYAELTLEGRDGSPAYVAPMGHPALRAAATALEEAYGTAPDYIRMGGSVPVVPTFQRELSAPTVLMGFGLPDENLHAPNEHFSLDNFERGMLAIWRFWTLI